MIEWVMFGLNKRKFEALHRLLWKVAAKPTNTRLLLALQKALIEQITRVEARIHKAKQSRRAANSMLKAGGRSRAASTQLRNRIREIDFRIEALNHLLFVWRCFGDGVAFIHLDKFALKQTYFETVSILPKQSAGWISGKAGLVVELEELERVSRSGVPVLLTDLTNTIRHGDLCVLVGPDPLLLESKTSSRLNSRGKRQKAALEKLETFYATDTAKQLRGYEEIRRVQVHSEELTYVDELNAGIEMAQHANISCVRPEAGLHYVAVYGGAPEDMGAAVGSLMQESTQAIYLNEFKSRGDWAPYSPFVLSIRKCQHLFDFVRGQLGLIVLFDNSEFDRRLATRGISRVDDVKVPEGWEDDYVTLKNIATGAQAGVSRQLLLRMFLEFTSPDWMADYFEQLLNRIEAPPAEDIVGRS